MARPREPFRIAVVDALRQGNGTTRAIAQVCTMRVDDTRRTLKNMCACNEAYVIESIRVQGVRRPVPVYALRPADVDPARRSAAPGVDLSALMANWAGSMGWSARGAGGSAKS